MTLIGNTLRAIFRRAGELVRFVMPLGGQDADGRAQASRIDSGRLAMHFAPQYDGAAFVIAGGVGSVSQALTPGVTFIRVQCPTQASHFTLSDGAGAAAATDHYMAQGEIIFMRIDPAYAAPNINVIVPGGAANVYVSEVS